MSMLKFEHPNLVVDNPAPGHYIITGYTPVSVFVPDVGHFAPPPACYISPEIPSDLLLKIAEDRGDWFDTSEDDEPAGPPAELLNLLGLTAEEAAPDGVLSAIRAIVEENKSMAQLLEEAAKAEKTAAGGNDQ